MSDGPGDPSAFFWQAAEATLDAEDVQTGTMMGFPCLRVDGAFFASCDHRTGDLVVKLSPTRVEKLITAGDGKAFAPAGRVFRQWVLVSGRDADLWSGLIAEARRFVQG